VQVTAPAHRALAKRSYLFAFIRDIRVFRVPIALSRFIATVGKIGARGKEEPHRTRQKLAYRVDPMTRHLIVRQRRSRRSLGRIRRRIGQRNRLAATRQVAVALANGRAKVVRRSLASVRR
jgi:hypothetical protein